MKRVLGAIVLLLAASGLWAQSTWRGQAEIWTARNLPADGLVAASNEFPPNTLLTIENYKTHKSVQVRVVAALPSGSTDLVLLSPRAAQALDIKAGEVPLVGAQIDASGLGADRPDNPDPDVNPLAPQTADGSKVATPIPLPPVAISPGTGLPVSNEPDATPNTAAKRVFQSTTNPPTPAPGADPTPIPPVSVPSDLSTSTPPPVAEAPVAAPPAPADQPADAAPAADAPPAAPAAVTVLPVKPAPDTDWVAVPRRLEGPTLGQVPLLASLEKGKPYVQLGTWATEAEVLATLDKVKSYVPLALYKAEGQKNPWRVVATAPKAQLGVLLMLFRSEGLRYAAVVKG
jgi:hypothetical protein